MFFDCLMKVLRKNYQKDHIEDMMIKVKNDVAQLNIIDEYNIVHKQMPCTWSTLTEKVYIP